MKMSSFIAMIFDVETTGLLRLKGSIMPPLHTCPHILQCSYLLYDIRNREILKVVNNYVKLPDYVNIPNEASVINGITRDVCDTKGKPMVNILEEFYNDYHQAHMMVAHNFKFDSRMMDIEFQRHWPALQQKCPYALNLFSDTYMKSLPMQHICTMESCTNMCAIVFPSSQSNPQPDSPQMARYKWPTLLELHKHLFMQEPNNLHNSIVDCMVCLRCFLKVYANYHMEDGEFEKTVKQLLNQ